MMKCFHVWLICCYSIKAGMNKSTLSLYPQSTVCQIIEFPCWRSRTLYVIALVHRLHVFGNPAVIAARWFNIWCCKSSGPSEEKVTQRESLKGVWMKPLCLIVTCFHLTGVSGCHEERAKRSHTMVILKSKGTCALACKQVMFEDS